MVLSTPGGLEETLIRAIISQIIAPLEHMHKHGRIFRDLKAKVRFPLRF
jgi:serine/threonine protein kinase